MKSFRRWPAFALLALLPGLACARAEKPEGPPTAPKAPKLAAFPGAEGFGAATPGGRGGKVIHVTNLNASGPGSLQEACSTSGPRMVVFEVSGVIGGDVVITEPFITIAGQTAPGAGITIAGRLLTRYSQGDPVHDVVVRFLRVRVPPGLGNQGDAVQFSIVRDAVLDHLSLAWAEDETIDLYTEAHNVTVQWCTLEEPSKTEEPGGGHHYGLITSAKSDHISVHHNLFSHVARRIPCFGSGPGDFRNNVAYDFRDGFLHDGNYGGKPGFNIIANYYQQGPSDRRQIFPFCFEDKIPYYLRDNYIKGLGLIQDPWKEADKLPGLQYYAAYGRRQEQETPVAPVTTQSAQKAYRLVLAQAGCFPRDAITKRNVADVSAGSGSWGRKEQKDLMEGLRPGQPPKDADRDGMPEAWEATRGLDPAVDDSARLRASGYTAIEEYVNELAAKLVTPVR